VEWFKEQFQKSNIISGVLALAIWGAIIYLAVASQPIPDILYGGGLSVVAFFFGTKKGEADGTARAMKVLASTRREV